MKKLMVIVVALVLAMGASAQHSGHGSRGGWHGGHGGHVYIARPRVSIGIGAYSPFYYSPFGYYPYGYPYGYGDVYGRNYRPSKLQVQIEDIKNDYSDKIWSAKHDTSLSRKERRKMVHELKSERDKTINDAKRNYYKY